MKVIKITALWCSACIIMNKIWNEIIKEKNIETIALDYDMDEEEAMKYNPGEVLPVFVFLKDGQEVERLRGEHSKEELLNIIEKLGD